MAVHVYVTQHLEVPDIPASDYLFTTVSPRELAPEELVAVVLGKTPDPIRRVWHYVRTFPEVGAHPEWAIGQVEKRYADCAGCHLSSRRNLVCHLRGDPGAAVACLGEGPGRTEDSRGVPFCGASGRLQDRIFEGQGIDPDKLAWLNLVGCRPHDGRYEPDRPPTLVERAACAERTLMLLRAVRPSVVICLGAEATGMFWEEAPPPWTWHVMEGCGRQVVVAHARHPSYLLRTITAPGGERELEAARRFYAALAERLPACRKLDIWPLPIRYLAELGAGRVLVGT